MSILYGFTTKDPGWRTIPNAIQRQWSIPMGTWTSNWHKTLVNISTISIDLILTFCWCQIANIWTSTHEIWCVENDHWETNLVKTIFGWKFEENNLADFFYTNVWHHFDANSWRQIWSLELSLQKLSFLTYGWWSVDVNCWHHFDISSTFLKNEWTMLSLNTIYVWSSIRALGEVRHTIRS